MRSTRLQARCPRGVYFVTVFSGLLVPYWDPGLLVGLTSDTTPVHIPRATLRANTFQTRGSNKEHEARASKSDLTHLKVGGGMTERGRGDGGARRCGRVPARDAVRVPRSGRVPLSGLRLDCLGGIWRDRRRLGVLQ
jgi:hypothetical protein